MSYSNVIRGAAALIAALLAAQAMAATPAQTTAATPDEAVCRDQLRPGSRIVMHLCASRVDWAASAERTATDLRVLPKSASLPPVFSTAFPHQLGNRGF